jgi:hypothetical protein
MKKKILFFVAIIALTIVGIVGTVQTTTADINPDCPNGCVSGSTGCHCFIDYPQYAEAVWKEDQVAPVD